MTVVLGLSDLVLLVQCYVCIAHAHDDSETKQSHLGSATDVSVQLDLLTPIVNKMYFVRATLLVPSNESSWYHKPFTFTGVETECLVRHWKFCNEVIGLREIPEGTCGCNSRHVDGTLYVYRFYWNIGPALAIYNERQFNAHLGGEANDTQIMEVVTFTASPETVDGQIFVCEERRISLNWTFTPDSRVVKAKFQVSTIEWFEVVKKRSRLVARLVHAENRKTDVLISRYYKELVEIHVEENIAVYTLLMVGQLPTHKIVVRISVSFNRTRFESVTKKSFQQNKTNYNDVLQHHQERWKRASQNSVDKAGKQTLVIKRAAQIHTSPGKTPRQVMSLSASNKNSLIPIPVGNNLTATTTANTTTAATTTIVPELEYKEEEDFFYNLEDRVEIVPLIGPERHLKATLEIQETVTGSFILMCTLPKGSLGSPPVNLTLSSKSNWKDENATVLVSHQGVQRLRYSPLYMRGELYICNLRGLAMHCCNSTDPVAQDAYGNYTAPEAARFLENVKLSFVMYGLQTFVALMVLLWTVSNFIQHLHLLAWRRRMILGLRMKSMKIKEPPMHPMDSVLYRARVLY